MCVYQYLLVLVFSSNHFYFIFLFCRAAVGAVSLVHPVRLFLPIDVLCGFVMEQIKIDDPCTII